MYYRQINFDLSGYIFANVKIIRFYLRHPLSVRAILTSLTKIYTHSITHTHTRHFLLPITRTHTRAALNP